MWESFWGLSSLDTSKEICNLSATFTGNFIHDGPLHKRMFHSYTTRMWVSCMQIKCNVPDSFMRLKNKKPSPQYIFSVHVKRAVWDVNAALLVALLFSHALCIVGRSEVGEIKWGSSFERSRSCSITGQKTTHFATPKAGRFSKASLITNCGQGFIYKPQSFYSESEKLISCLPILGHHCEQRSREESGGFFIFSIWFSC